MQSSSTQSVRMSKEKRFHWNWFYTAEKERDLGLIARVLALEIMGVLAKVSLRKGILVILMGVVHTVLLSP